jgi:integrase
MVQLLVLVGQRRDEVRKAIRSEFDHAGRTWKLPAHRTKNGHEHHVPLSDMALTIFKCLPANHTTGAGCPAQRAGKTGD